MAKDSTIILRVEPETKAKLMQLAKDNRRELSDYIRLIFDDTIKKKTKV